MTASARANGDRFEVHIDVATAGGSAIDLLQPDCGLSRQAIKRAMNSGAVWLTRGSQTNRLRRAKRSLRAGDELHLYYDKKVLAEVPVAPVLVADKESYSVWNKPYGLRSQGSKWGDHCTITRWAERHLKPERPAFTVHRLDRAANGLILIAHTKTMAASLSSLFRDRNIEKRYRAIVAGDFSALDSPVLVDEPIDGKTARSELRFCELLADGTQSLVEVTIETGRKHQIRRHLAFLGFPVVGDRMYGGALSDSVDLQLTACRLAFKCPSSGEPTVYEC